MANYTLGIVAYVERQEQIAKLRDELYPDLIEVDDGTFGVMGNHCLTLEKLYQSGRRSGQEWLVVLEDDAQPIDGFHRQLSAALDVAPSPVVSLYNGSGYPGQRQGAFYEATLREDVCWIQHRSMRHAVGYAIHMGAIEMGLLDAMIEYQRRRWPPDDAMSVWCKRQGELVSYTNPSLVQHEDGPPTLKTRTNRGIATMNIRRRPRKAHWVGTRFVWTDSSVTI